MKETRGLNSFSEQIAVILNKVAKSDLMSQMGYGSQLKKLNQLSSRISNIFVGLAKQCETNRIYYDRKYQETLENKDSSIFELKEKVSDLKPLYDEVKIEFENSKESHIKQSEELSNNKERIGEQLKMIKVQEEQKNKSSNNLKPSTKNRCYESSDIQKRRTTVNHKSSTRGY